MKLPSRRRTLAALALWLVFLLMTLPAQHLVGWFGGPRIAAQGVDGTLWKGRAEHMAFDGVGFGPLLWQLRPLALLSGRLEFQCFVQSGRGGGELRFGRSIFGATFAREVRLTLPAADLGRQLRLPLVRLEGDFQIDLDELRAAAGGVESVRGRVAWQGARVLQPDPLPLGTLTLQLDTRDGRIGGVLGDEGGPLELSGELSVETDRSYRLDALLKARAEAPPQLRQALGLLGAPDAQGRYRLRYSGSLQM